MDQGIPLDDLKLNKVYRCVLTGNKVLITEINKDLPEGSLKHKVRARYFDGKDYKFFEPCDGQLAHN